MRIRQTPAILGLVTTLLCSMAFSSPATDQAGDPAWIDVFADSESVMQQPLLLAKNGDDDENEKYGKNDKDDRDDKYGKNDKDDRDDKYGMNDKNDKNGKGDRDDKDHWDDWDDDRGGYGHGHGHGHDKVYVCHFLPNGKFHTQKLPEKTANKLVKKHPDMWARGKCEDIPSLS